MFNTDDLIFYSKKILISKYETIINFEQFSCSRALKYGYYIFQSFKIKIIYNSKNLFSW
jgi:hypothetical protein